MAAAEPTWLWDSYGSRRCGSPASIAPSVVPAPPWDTTRSTCGSTCALRHVADRVDVRPAAGRVSPLVRTGRDDESRDQRSEAVDAGTQAVGGAEDGHRAEREVRRGAGEGREPRRRVVVGGLRERDRPDRDHSVEVLDLGRLQERWAGVEVGLGDASRCMARGQVTPHRCRRSSASCRSAAGRQGDGQEWVTGGNAEQVGEQESGVLLLLAHHQVGCPGPRERDQLRYGGAWPGLREHRLAPGCRRTPRGWPRSGRPAPARSRPPRARTCVTWASWSAPGATRTSCPACLRGQREWEHGVEMAPAREGGDQHPHLCMMAGHPLVGCACRDPASRWSSLSRPGAAGRACRDPAPRWSSLSRPSRPRWSSLSRPGASLVEPVETRALVGRACRDPASVGRACRDPARRWSSLSRPGVPLVEPVETPRLVGRACRDPRPVGRACRDPAPLVEPVETPLASVRRFAGGGR